MTFNIRRLKARLQPEEARAETWKRRAERRAARVSELEAAIGELQARVAARERRLAEVRRRLDSMRHTSPRPEILRQILGIRAQHLPVSAGERVAAEARERRLREASAPYAAATNDTGDSASVERSEIEGLPWWVPLDAQVGDRVERVERQGFPLRAILQTREVALGGVMLDLGANIGRTSIPRLLLGDVRAIYAAEPEPRNYACLVRNVAEYGLQGFVLPDQVAIGAERGEVELRVSRYPGGHRVLHRRRHPVETVTVRLWPLDEWMRHVGVEPEAVTFVKVDTQGSEVDVLKGAPALLARRHVAWQLELDPKLLKSAGARVKELFRLLEARFSHFIDLGRDRAGPRSRPIRDLREALSDVGTRRRKTDLLVYHGGN